MSQLNPDAKEFIPVSPTRNTVSPTYNRDVMDDLLIAQSPRRAVPMDISVPSPVEFQYEVKQRPSEVFEELNKGHDNQNVCCSYISLPLSFWLINIYFKITGPLIILARNHAEFVKWKRRE